MYMLAAAAVAEREAYGHYSGCLLTFSNTT